MSILPTSGLDEDIAPRQSAAMSAIRVYTYAKCSTCRKATAWLRARNLEFRELPIRETPPSLEELRWMHAQLGSRTRLFNSSGLDYRSLGLSQKLPGLSDDEAYVLLRSNGNLVKRPFLVTPHGGTTGFREAAWADILG